MRFLCSTVLLLMALVAPIAAGAELSPEQLDRNRKLLDQIRSDPEQMRRLLDDFKSFQQLPKARQEQLRQLDRALNKADPATQQRLWAALERYYLWLERLSPADRKRIETAASKSERLKTIRELRDRQWLEQQPRRDREELLKVAPERRAAAIARLRAEDRKRRLAWQKALRTPPWPAQAGGPRPSRLDQLPADVRSFVANQLVPMLNDKEKEALEKAEGHWPRLPLTILYLSEHHPVLPPFQSRSGATNYWELPPQTRDLLPKRFARNKLAGLEKHKGKWPDFALAVTDLLHKEGKTPTHPLGASRPREFPALVQHFLERTLTPALSEGERKRLKETEGKWPEYPKLLHELAEAHKVRIPGMSLPGSHEMWAAARSVLPEVPDQVLREFASTELSDDERSRLNISTVDPTSRDRIKQEYYRKHPNELKRRRLAVERAPGQ